MCLHFANAICGKWALSPISSSQPQLTDLENSEEYNAVSVQDAPGTWTRHVHDSNPVPFYYNKKTGDSYYTAPPSCSWTRTNVDSHPMYVNSVTHETKWSRPPALCWKLLHAPGQRSTYAPALTA